MDKVDKKEANKPNSRTKLMLACAKMRNAAARARSAVWCYQNQGRIWAEMIKLNREYRAIKNG